MKPIHKITYHDNLDTTNVLDYFTEELKKTSLKKKQIKVDKKLQKLIGLAKIVLILADNDIDSDIIEVDIKHRSLLFVSSSNNVAIAKSELKLRFNDIFESTLAYLKNESENKTSIDIKSLDGYWESYYKGIMAGKKDDGYISIKNEDDLHTYITNKLGNVVDEIKIIEKGKTYPYNRSNPYYHDIYFVSLMNGTSFEITRIYGRPNWSGNVDYKEQLEVSNIK